MVGSAQIQAALESIPVADSSAGAWMDSPANQYIMQAVAVYMIICTIAFIFSDFGNSSGFRISLMIWGYARWPVKAKMIVAIPAPASEDDRSVSGRMG